MAYNVRKTVEKERSAVALDGFLLSTTFAAWGNHTASSRRRQSITGATRLLFSQFDMCLQVPEHVRSRQHAI